MTDSTHVRLAFTDIIVSKEEADNIQVFRIMSDGSKESLETYYVEDCDEDGEAEN